MTEDVEESATSHNPSIDLQRLPDEAWVPVLQKPCEFDAGIFESVSLNLLKNPNINSSLLFRADILYDSEHELTDEELPTPDRQAALQQYGLRAGELSGFTLYRTLLRRMIPRNPQLDKPILQTCLFFKSTNSAASEQQTLVLSIPHAETVDAIPWYHPRVQSLAYLHTWPTTPSSSPNTSSTADTNTTTGTLSLHYQLFPTSPSDPPSPSPLLTTRLERTAHHLLTTLLKHGTGRLAGYEKRVHHDLLVPQARVQDTYTELKRKHAKRLCDAWVEKTEPSKHVFEDLGIAAFLIELWRDMYELPSIVAAEGGRGGQKKKGVVGMIGVGVGGWKIKGGSDGGGSGDKKDHGGEGEDGKKVPFPGFVDIGCGNGVLVDVLIREGFKGWGFDARRRKTWDTFEPFVRKHLQELILIPEPLRTTAGSPDDNLSNRLDGVHLTSTHSNRNKSPKKRLFAHLRRSPSPPSSRSHNGIFPTGTFIISNHADELTPWTPLLASLSSSPFLCIPCCSHNLSGQRFRAPSTFNNNTADAFAPSYFANHRSKSKAVAITVAHTDHDGMYSSSPLSCERCMTPSAEEGEEQADDHHEDGKIDGKSSSVITDQTGDLKTLAAQRKNQNHSQPSAYSSLCDWVANLAVSVGYEVEKEMLRLPSTRNVGLVGRSWQHHASFKHNHGEGNGEGSGGEGEGEEENVARRRRVEIIVRREKADLRAWVKRAEGLSQEGGGGCGCGH